MEGPTWVAGTLRLSDGRIVVADGGEHQIRFFSSTGAPLNSVGQRGRGPGEFDRLWDLKRYGDTLVGIDARGVGQIFSPDGTYLRTVERPSPTIGQRATLIGFLIDGEPVLYESLPLGGSDSLLLMVLRTTRPRRGESSLGVFPLRQVTRVGTMVEPVAFGAEGKVVVTAQFVCVGWSHQMVVQCRKPSGPWANIVLPWQVPAREPNDHDKQVYFRGIDLANPGPRGQAYRERVRITTVFAESMPAIGRMLGTLTDEIWIGPPMAEDMTIGSRNPVATTPTLWRVMGSNGDLLAEVEIPANFRLLEAGRDYVLGIRKNSDESEDVVMYALLRGP